MDKKVWATCGEFEYIQLPQQHLQDALEVLNLGFYPFESVCRVLGIAKVPEAVADLNRLSACVSEDEVSIIAMERKTNRVVGVAFNKLQVNSSSGEAGYFEKFLETCKHPASRKLMELMIEADALCNLFEKCNTNCLLEIMFLSVHPDYRKAGIGLKLCEVSIELAKSLQGANAPGAVCALFTSPISQKIGSELGMTVPARLAYADVHFNGKSFADVLEPNNKDIAVAYKLLKTN
ncbi:unnamed protein product [Acanthoscelides obtectus]|uniref:Uncharacterized protein n=1 Tax=Acanthoscelides obtectus TaxID=200917 RepID=A0A9P0JQT4_ACAOB|nr:unnamed protein product [Acanthoscelides obtectus]CAK1661912.1 hypothetical protein AOBTE_LOCUS22875 [Acanthoscelides obtectus]